MPGWQIDPLSSIVCTMGRRILIADDEGINRLFVKTVLMRNGWEVTDAENGQEVLDLVKREHFDIILMDIKMPVMNGLEAMREIRELRENGHTSASVPILGLTAYSDELSRREIEESGMNGIIAKPVDEKALIRQIESYLS